MNKRRLILPSGCGRCAAPGLGRGLPRFRRASGRRTSADRKTAPAARAAVHAAPLPPSAGGAAVVDAANAFLATLSEQQRTVAQIELTPQNAARWSNFPAAVVPRNGVYFRDMNAAQTAAALKIARLALSAEGFARFQEVRATDDAFAKIDDRPGRRPGGPGGRRSRRAAPGGFGGPPPGLAAPADRAASAGPGMARPLRPRQLHHRVPGQAVEDHALAAPDSAATIWPSTFTTKARPARRPPTSSACSRTSGRTRTARRTRRSRRCATPCTT